MSKQRGPTSFCGTQCLNTGLLALPRIPNSLRLFDVRRTDRLKDDERQIAQRPSGGGLALPTDVVARSLVHARSLAAGPATTALALSGNIFDAIDRFDLNVVERIVQASPSVIFCKNKNGVSP